GAHALTFSGASPIGTHTPTVTDNGSSAVDFGTPTTVTFTGGVSSAGGSLTLYAAGNANMVAAAGAVTTTGADRLAVAVSPAATSTLTLTAAAASPQPAGVPFDLTVASRDPYGNPTPAYRGTVGFTSSDGQAALPSPHTFTAGDGGTHTFGAGV